MILTRKIQLLPLGDKEELNRIYTYIRDGMFNQNKGMNQFISALYVSFINEFAKEDRKELVRLYGRNPESSKGSAYSADMSFAKGLGSASSLTRKCQQSFDKAVKDGLLYGRVSLPTFRMDNPLLVPGRFIDVKGNRIKNDGHAETRGIYHLYASHEEFLDHLHNSDLEIYLDFVNGIHFKFVLGNPHKSRFLREEIKQIFEGYYKICDSSIGIDGKKIMLNLCMDVPKKEIVLDENKVIGVDMGLAVPAVCVCYNRSTNKYEGTPLYIGEIDELLTVRTRLQAERRRLQKALADCTSGGHGRKKKLAKLEDLKKRERHFVQTYNHMVSRRIVKFAEEHGAKYINVEDLSDLDSKLKSKLKDKFDEESGQFVLRNFSYFERQNYTEYKAARYEMVVRKINPDKTSQTCSCCGNYEPGQRISQSTFKCKKCGYEENADVNAAKNIAFSENFVEKVKTPKKTKTNEQLDGIEND